MTTTLQNRGKGIFGTSAVFFTALSTILGAILFLRFGYAVAHVGFMGTLFIILLGHLVTIPTAMAIAEIATNQRVEGGGEYYILSRSFGLIIGAAIGISLYFSQAISVAFYLIAFAEAFRPVFDFVQQQWGWVIQDGRVVSFPAALLLTGLIIRHGANFGMTALYFVVAILFLALAMFFLGSGLTAESNGYARLIDTVDSPAPIFVVFAICFPAFTGMTAGVGLSGDLRDPKRSIPMGTLGATLVGLVVYILVAYKLATSASPEQLGSDQLIMSRIAIWGPIIPIGLACATISSAVGSFLVAPRTLQALAGDRTFPSAALNKWLAQGGGERGEPRNASMTTAIIAIVFILVGDVDVVAQVIAMFFMVTYGAICLVSFLEHLAAEPSYRPTFRSRWYVSLIGAIFCAWLAFQMSVAYTILAIVIMGGLYFLIASYSPENRGLSRMFQGALFQVSRLLQVFMQKASRDDEIDGWRPSVVCVSTASFDRLAAFELLRWIAHRYGFGTYIHLKIDYLSRETSEEARESLQRLIKLADASDSNVFVDTLVSPSFNSAIANLVQLPGVSGKENNTVLLEFSKRDTAMLEEIIGSYKLVASIGFDVCILASSDRGFGYRRTIHVWMTPSDYENANVMILLAYVLLGHPDWGRAQISILAIVSPEEMENKASELRRLVAAGRIPVSAKNVELIPEPDPGGRRNLINQRSRSADLVVLGFQGALLRRAREELFTGYPNLGNMLFVNTTKSIDLLERDETIVDEAGVDASVGAPAAPSVTLEELEIAGAEQRSTLDSVDTEEVEEQPLHDEHEIDAEQETGDDAAENEKVDVEEQGAEGGAKPKGEDQA